MSLHRQADSEAESIEDFPVPSERKNDTIAEEVEDFGKDLQAIDWNELQWPRAQYRYRTCSEARQSLQIDWYIRLTDKGVSL